MQTSLQLRARLVALLCMAGLFVSWSHPLAHDHTTLGDTLGHTLGHELGHTLDAIDGDDREDDFQVSSDDSHHEHSSRKALEIEACLACRSGSQDDADRPPSAQVAIQLCIAGRLPTARTKSWQRVLPHAHAPRAPPSKPTPTA